MGSGLILTGGGAELAGIEGLFAQKLKIRVLKRKPDIKKFILDSEAEAQISHLKFSTVLGLLELNLQEEMPNFKKRSYFANQWNGFKTWLGELA